MKKVKNKRKSLIEAELEMEKLLKRVGYTGKFSGKTPYDIPQYRTKSDYPSTSDVVPTKTPKKTEQKYTGTEIAGIVVTHKSNLMPVRKDNKQAAVDAAQMRRN
jgi:hypothetical protein